MECGLEGCRQVWGERQGRRGRGVALDVRETFVCAALTVRDHMVESLWLRMRGLESKGDGWCSGCELLSGQAGWQQRGVIL